MSSTPSVQVSKLDFSKLKFVVFHEEGEPDPVDYNSDDDEYAFTHKLVFTVANPYPPPLPVVQEDFKIVEVQRDGVPTQLRLRRTLPRIAPPEPLVEIEVRTIEREMIPSDQFYAYMDNICDDFKQFSMAVFTANGHIKPTLLDRSSPHRGAGVWGSEINYGTLVYIETIKVSPKYQRQGVGRWAIDALLKCEELEFRFPYFFTWATPINTHAFGAPSDSRTKEFEKQGVIDFWRSVGFRRVGGTGFFGYARDPEHPMRSLKAEDDAKETQTSGGHSPGFSASFW